MKKNIIILLLLCFTICSIQIKVIAQTTSNNKPTNLLVEDHKNPLNVHQQQPNLSWYSNITSQSAYQIQVSEHQASLLNNIAELWDSGKTNTNQSVNIKYLGRVLAANKTAYWRVRVWSKINDTDETVSQWSDIQSWEMGLIEKSDWQAKWLQVTQPVIGKNTVAVNEWMEHATDLSNKNLKGGKLETQQRVFEQLKNKPTASLFRYQFSTAINKKIIKAKLHSTAAGYYEIFINGQKVDDRIMDPGQTDFDKRILYNTDNVLSFLEQGDNTIAVHLGSGWYDEPIAFSNPEKNYFLGYGQPKFIAQLELFYNDGSSQIVTSNEQWLSHSSPVLKEGIFSGELFDANLVTKNWFVNTPTTDLSDWQPVTALTEWPTEVLEPQMLPAIRAVKKLAPIDIFNPEKNVWVLDFGQNFTGIPTVEIKKLGLTRNQTIHFRYAEWADKKGNISQTSGGGAPLLKQVDTYIASGNDQTSWTPTFTWHGFRYVEIRGLKQEPPLDAVVGHLVRSDVERVGSFVSSDPLLNRIHNMALWSYEGNLMALPMDCPIRERAGWTGDAHAALITGNYNFNMQNFWQKYLGDFKTSKHTAAAIVPGKRSHGGTYDWAVAEIIIAWEHYRHHGDLALLASQYQSMLKYMRSAEQKLDNSLMRTGYGDWCDPVREPGMSRVNGRCSPQHTTPTMTSSAFLAHAADLMTKISILLDKPEQAEHFTTLYQTISKQYHQEFFDDKTGHYGSQTADSLALRFGITPEHLRQRVADALNNDVINSWGGHASVGALGQTYLYLALSDHGYADTAFNIFKAKGYPGYSYLFDTLNATTLWERKGGFVEFDKNGKQNTPGRSLNHPFHSGYDGWFYEGLGGIRPLETQRGYQQFELRPVFPAGLDNVDVSYKTGYGIIKSQWQRQNNTIQWSFEIPNNTSAYVTIPNQAKTLYKAGKYTVEIQL